MKNLNRAGLGVALACGIAAPAFAQSTAAGTCQAVNEAQIEALFDRWNGALRTLDADQVVNNYAADGVLLATVANEPRASHAQIREYFVKFLKNGPQGKIDRRFVKIGCNVAQDVGTYTFTFNNGQTVKARYTFVYEWKNGQWLIAHHHSSVMPELSAVAAK